MKTIKKRRKENKTDYGRRFKLLKGEKTRIVFRKTNKYLVAQEVESKEAQDKIITGITSRDLLKYGWPKEGQGSLKSTTASYLLGYLFGKKIKDKNLPVVDFGMLRVLPRTKVHAFLNGLFDAGIKIGIKKEYFPPKDRLEGKHLKNKIPFSEIKSKIEKEK